jgi:hypothetical protein
MAAGAIISEALDTIEIGKAHVRRNSTKSKNRIAILAFGTLLQVPFK